MCSPWGHKESDTTKRRAEEGIPLLEPTWGFPDQLVKNPPAMQEILVRFLGREDPLENGQATHASILGLPVWLSW